MTENDPPELVVVLPSNVDPTNILTVLFASAVPVTVGVLSVAPVITDRLDGADGAVYLAAALVVVPVPVLAVALALVVVPVVALVVVLQ